VWGLIAVAIQFIISLGSKVYFLMRGTCWGGIGNASVSEDFRCGEFGADLALRKVVFS